MNERGVDIRARVARRGVDLSVRLAPGRVTAILGPNGAGKSTLVRLVSGELQPDEGTVRIDGVVVAGPGFIVPPHQRRVAVLAQRPSLFPHLRVLDNVAFGLRARGVRRVAARERAAAELEAVGAGGFASRRTASLSGGEAQRVAVARALAIDPDVVLLDEPLAPADVDTATELRGVLARRLRDSRMTVGVVTHDPLDVWALADDVVALDHGACVAAGTVEGVLGRPATGFLARLAGVNLINGIVRGTGLSTGADEVAGLWDAAVPAREGRPCFATFPPDAVALFRDVPHGSPRNTWGARIVGLEPRGATVRLAVELSDGQPVSADLTAQGVAALDLAPGDRLFAQVKATQVALFPR